MFAFSFLVSEISAPALLLPLLRPPCLPLHRQVSRTKAGRLVACNQYRAGNASNIGLRQPQDSANYNSDEEATTKFRKAAGARSFERTTGRPPLFEPPTSASAESQKLYNIAQSERINIRHAATPDFARQTGRPKFLQQPPLDLDYAPQYESVQAKSPNATIKSVRGSWQNVNAVTADLDYEPHYGVTSPRTDHTVAFDKGSGRRSPMATKVDQFYDTDSPWTSVRVKGNPMMGSQMSRQAVQPRKSSNPDNFYDYDVDVTQPCYPRDVLQFTKSAPRGTQGLAGRLGATVTGDY